MTVFIIIIIVILIVVFLLNASNKQLKYEVQKEGGLINIFANLEAALFKEDFVLYSNKITSLEYHNRINEYSFLKLEVKKTFESSPYQMQMTHILNGQVNQKTMPYIISPDFTTEKFRQELVRMLKEIMEKQVTSIMKNT